MKKMLRIILYTLAFVVPIGIFAVVGSMAGMDVMMGASPNIELPTNINVISRPFDPNKPTVAILLGDSMTEVTDFMIPYEIFSATGAFNVFGVAPERRLTTLTGGLDVVPDYSMSQLDELLGKSPEIIVTPAMMGIHDAQNRPIIDWLQRHAANPDTIFFSICSGAEVLAAAGLLDGHTATTFWADIDGFERQYTHVNWLRGLRFAVDGNLISSAGVTSGIDAALYIVAKHLGLETAERIANELHYPNFDFVTHPQVEQYYPAPADAIYLLNASFDLSRASYGVLLYSGVGEIELASIFDTYPASFTTRTYAIAPEQRLISTKHGLKLFPRYSYTNVPVIERLLVPGRYAYQLATAETGIWRNDNVPLVYLHADMPERFAFDAPLIDLAHVQDTPTAAMAAKRVEYRPLSLTFEGSDGSPILILLPLLVGLSSLVLVVGVEWLVGYLRRRNTPSISASYP